MMGIMAAVEMRCLIDEGQQQGSPDNNVIVIEPTTQAVKLSGNLAECDNALSKLLASEPIAVQSALKGMMRTVVTVESRAVAAFLHLHPSIYGRGSLKSRMDRTAAALGVGPATLPKWFSLRNLESKRYVEKWLPIAKELTWEKVRASFYSAWANQWKLEATDTVTAHLGVYEKYIAGSMMSYISRHTSGTTTAGRKSSAMNDCNTVVVKMGTKIVRLDKSKGRKHLSQEAFVIERVKERWKQGDPIGKIELKDEVMVRDECDNALSKLLASEPIAVQSALKGMMRTVVTVESRAVAAFLHLHPSIYGRGSLKSRMDRTAAALGVGPATLPKWFSLRNLESKRYVEKWLPIAKELTWEKVRASFYSAWANQWKLEATDTVTAHLGVYEKYIAGSMMSYISRHTSGTTTAGRKSSAMNDCNTVVVKMGTKIVRLDKSKGRKHLSQEAFVIERVKERWKQGDPIGKIELKDEVMVRDDCGPGTAFYQSYIDPTKTSALSGWINWLSRVLSRGGWSLRANSIGQTVPENWRSMAEENTKKICTRFKEENIQVTINADQTFVNFFMEEKVVVAPTGTKRIGGKIKADVKKGFTLMVGCCLETGQMEPPFAVFDGTKLCTAKFKERTLAWKHRNWRHSVPGRAGFMAFQKKHWFDQDITIQWLEWVLDVLYPGKKVGISLDMAPAQQLTGHVKEYVDKRTAEGRLVLEYIDGGLTSVLQIADLAANKDIKAIIKRLYLTYRRGFIRTERAKYPGEPDKRITMKLPIVAMMEIIEAGVVEFNMKQRESESIKKTFISAGQHPWKDCTLEFTP